MSSKIAELFTFSTDSKTVDWGALVSSQQCTYVGKKCFKTRKSDPDVSIGTCSLKYGASSGAIMICPNRLLERGLIFRDCMHLLTLHEPGNCLYLLPEVSLPGGSIDYVLVSERDGDIVDFVGIELQTLDTTGTVWPERQRFLARQGFDLPSSDVESSKRFAMNWKMTAKTILVQMHHKIETFEAVSKHLVLVVQDQLYAYFESVFDFGAVGAAVPEHAMHFHSYALAKQADSSYSLSLAKQTSTTAAGVAQCMSAKADGAVGLEELKAQLIKRIGPSTAFNLPEDPASSVAPGYL